MFEDLIYKYPGQIIAICCHSDEQFKELYDALEPELFNRFESVMKNMHDDRHLDFAFSIQMPEFGEPGRPKWDGWCEVEWYLESGYVVVDFESVFDEVQVFEPPDISLCEEQT